MEIVKTTEDGWNVIPELKEAVEYLDEISDIKYEIKNCVRASDLEDMVSEMKTKLEEAIDKLDEIDSYYFNVEFETIEE